MARGFVCPVCDYSDPSSAAYEGGQNDWYQEICPSCGTQFGYDDAGTSHEELRQRWLSAGARSTFLTDGDAFTASETRRELLVRLAEAMTDDAELADLIAFLRDDLAYASTNRSIVGAVLREAEFEPWRDLMVGVERPSRMAFEDGVEGVRDLARKLLAEMRS